MHLGHYIAVLVFIPLISGCASLGAPKAELEGRNGLSPRELSLGECGLFVWKADQTKTFILFADDQGAALYRDGDEIVLSRTSNDEVPSEYNFIDSTGHTISLTLLEAQSFQDSTRYKSGRLTSLDSNGWDIVTPVVGLYSCRT